MRVSFFRRDSAGDLVLMTWQTHPIYWSWGLSIKKPKADERCDFLRLWKIDYPGMTQPRIGLDLFRAFTLHFQWQRIGQSHPDLHPSASIY